MPAPAWVSMTRKGPPSREIGEEPRHRRMLEDLGEIARVEGVAIVHRATWRPPRAASREADDIGLASRLHDGPDAGEARLQNQRVAGREARSAPRRLASRSSGRRGECSSPTRHSPPARSRASIPRRRHRSCRRRFDRHSRCESAACPEMTRAASGAPSSGSPVRRGIDHGPVTPPARPGSRWRAPGSSLAGPRPGRSETRGGRCLMQRRTSCRTVTPSSERPQATAIMSGREAPDWRRRRPLDIERRAARCRGERSGRQPRPPRATAGKYAMASGPSRCRACAIRSGRGSRLGKTPSTASRRRRGDRPGPQSSG